MPQMSRLVLTVIILAGCGQGGEAGPRRTDHLPVHPSLDLAIVVPESMKRVVFGVVHLSRADVFDDAAAWIEHERLESPSYTFGFPEVRGNLWSATVTKSSGGEAEFKVWYRPLGEGLFIRCMPIRPGYVGPTAEDLELTERACVGTQLVRGGIYVPAWFTRRPDEPMFLELALLGEPLNWSVTLERAEDAPEWRFDPRGPGGTRHLVDRGSVADGEWFIAAEEHPGVHKHYDVVVRRRIGELDLACHGDNYRDSGYTHRQRELCLDLEAP